MSFLSRVYRVLRRGQAARRHRAAPYCLPPMPLPSKPNPNTIHLHGKPFTIPTNRQTENRYLCIKKHFAFYMIVVNEPNKRKAEDNDKITSFLDIQKTLQCSSSIKPDLTWDNKLYVSNAACKSSRRTGQCWITLSW